MSVDDKREKEFQALERFALESELNDVEKTAAVLKILQRKRDQVYAVNVKLPATERQDGDYGMVYYHLWKAGDVMDILGNPAFMKSVKNTALQIPEQLTKDEQKDLFSMKCDLVSRAMIGAKATDLQDSFAFVNFMFNWLMERSGAGSATVKDISDFLLTQSRASSMETSGSST